MHLQPYNVHITKKQQNQQEVSKYIFFHQILEG